MTEDVHRLIVDYYHFVCRGQVSVKGKGQMLTYFLEGRSLQGGRPSQQQLHPDCRSSTVAHGNVCTRLSPAPTITTYTTIRTPSPNLAKPTTSTSATRYLPSVPMAVVWQILSPWWQYISGCVGRENSLKEEKVELFLALLLSSAQGREAETLIIQ